MRAIPSFTSRTEPTSSTSSSWRSAASISRSRMSLISPGRSVVSDAIRSVYEGGLGIACEIYHKRGMEATGGVESTDGDTARLIEVGHCRNLSLVTLQSLVIQNGKRRYGAIHSRCPM